MASGVVHCIVWLTCAGRPPVDAADSVKPTGLEGNQTDSGRIHSEIDVAVLDAEAD